MRLSRPAFGLVLLLSAVHPTSASQPTPATGDVSAVSFAFERKGVLVPKYTLTIRADGSGSYEGEEIIYGTAPYAGVASPPQPFDRPVLISPPTVAHVFALAEQLDHFNRACASKVKNVADTGTKVLTYTGPDGSGTCTYNYSENKSVEALTETFQGIAETMDQGRELDRLHRYDRLGLDAAMTFLAQEVSEKRALEVVNIQTSLQAIAADVDVIQRVRTKANVLLAPIPASMVKTYSGHK